MSPSELDEWVIAEADRLIAEIAAYRSERAPLPVDPRQYARQLTAHDQLVHRIDDAGVELDPRVRASLRLLYDVVMDLARATTTSTPETDFER